MVKDAKDLGAAIFDFYYAGPTEEDYSSSEGPTSMSLDTLTRLFKTQPRLAAHLKAVFDPSQTLKLSKQDCINVCTGILLDR